MAHGMGAMGASLVSDPHTAYTDYGDREANRDRRSEKLIDATGCCMRLGSKSVISTQKTKSGRRFELGVCLGRWCIAER